jgi:hypothetical protein
MKRERRCKVPLTDGRCYVAFGNRYFEKWGFLNIMPREK